MHTQLYSIYIYKDLSFTVNIMQQFQLTFITLHPQTLIPFDCVLE